MSDPFVNAFLKAARPGWQPPEANIIVLNNNTMAKAASVTIQLDGWSDVNTTHTIYTSLINVVIYAGYPLLWKSIYPGATRHTGEYIAGIICEAIDTAELGAKIQAVVIDNPSLMKAAWRKRPGVVVMGALPIS